ncbi:MAG: SIMPL domain-containing protein [Candidatus Levybacteria bacterium]|nr:SIMPL domain-containing protein [Candidatus Levybacteria bacterium]
MIDRTFLKEYLLKPACFALVIIAVLFLLNKFTYFNFSLGSNQNMNSFEAIGTGEVTAVPDVAQTTFSIQERGTTQEAARSAANTKQTQAIEELKKLGVKEADIKTTGFYVNPNYEPDPITGSTTTDSIALPIRQNAQNGYVANVTTTVKAEKIETLNKAIDALTTIGINVSGVEYTFDDRQKYVLEAQNKAIEQAKIQAQDWARAAGFKLGKIVSIRNADEGYGYQPYAADSAVMNLKAGAPETQTDLQPGENQITARMGVTFYIR